MHPAPSVPPPAPAALTPSALADRELAARGSSLAAWAAARGYGRAAAAAALDGRSSDAGARQIREALRDELGALPD